MERAEFERRLREAAAHAQRFGQTFVQERLPESVRFRIELNASYDGNPLHPDERVFPGDSSPAVRSRFHFANADEVLELLWRGGATPEWINLSLAGELCGHTVLEMLVCGRFTDNEALLYHQGEGRPPFHVLGPALPPDYQDGERFSVYNRSVCWTRAELEHVSAFADRIWSLTLCGSKLDDAALRHLPPNKHGFELLELQETAVSGSSFSTLARHPKLRLLRARIGAGRAFDIGELGRRCKLEDLDLSNLPCGDWGFSRMRVPTVTTLRLHSAETLQLQGGLVRSAQTVQLEAPNARGLRLPKQLASLSLALTSARDEDVAALLSDVHSIRRLSLRGTSVSDDLVEPLVERLGLEFLDVVGTAVTPECIQRMEGAHPGLRLLPRPTVDLGYRMT